MNEINEEKTPMLVFPKVKEYTMHYNHGMVVDAVVVPLADEDGVFCYRYDKGGILEHLIPSIAKLIYNDPATIIIFDDGTKSVVKCQEGDLYSKERGFVFALLKRIYGPEYNDIMREYVWDNTVE